MKIIKLFLLLSFGLWADTKLDMPDIRSNIIDDVVKYGWEKADSNLKLLFEEKGTKFIENFLKDSKKSLKEQSDEEYLLENILSYSEPSGIEPEEYGLPLKVDEEKYLKYLKLTIKYDLKFMKYKRVFERDTYSYLMAYIKYLENKKEFTKVYDLYIKVLDRLVYIDKIVDKTMLNAIRKIVFNAIVKNALKESISHDYYTKQQIKQLDARLKMILMLSESYFEEIMLDEKRQSLAYMKIAVLEVENFEEFIDNMGQEKVRNSEIFEDLDYVTLKKYFENKDIMQKVLYVFSKKIDEHLNKLRTIKNNDDYLKLEDKYKKTIEKRLEKFEKRIGKKNKYKLSQQEFIDYASDAMFGYSRSWKIGKNKRDFIITIEKNKKFIELLD